VSLEMHLETTIERNWRSSWAGQFGGGSVLLFNHPVLTLIRV